MYFNLRLNEIKNAVEKQNRVLTAFITNVQQDIRSGGNCMEPMCENLAAPEALSAARRDTDKIVVSDDEESDEDDDSDTESDSEDEDTIKVVNLNIHQANVHPANVQPQEVDTIEPIQLSFEVLSSESSIANESFITEITDEPLNLVSSVDVSKEEHKSDDYEHMRVDDLRKVVSDKNLASKDEVKKLKKPELLVLLKKQ